MIRLACSAFVFATLVLSACAADNTDPVGGAGGKADGETPVIAFDGNWDETVTGTLLAGSPVVIRYDLDRLQDCRGSTGGSDVWGVTGYASFDGGAPQTFAVSRLVDGAARPVAAELEIPGTARSVAFWFSISNRWGCIAYDSNDSRNYTFELAAASTGAILSFDADWSEAQSAPLRAGDEVVVHYDPARLARCATTRNGYPAWSVTAHYQVDGGPVKTLTVTRADGSALVPADPTFVVPRGRELALWFSATSVHGCHAYDSNTNANYRYAIE